MNVEVSGQFGGLSHLFSADVGEILALLPRFCFEN